MNLQSPKKLSKNNLMMIADMRGIKVKNNVKKNYLRNQRKMLRKYTINHHLNQ